MDKELTDKMLNGEIRLVNVDNIKILVYRDTEINNESGQYEHLAMTVADIITTLRILYNNSENQHQYTALWLALEYLNQVVNES